MKFFCSPLLRVALGTLAFLSLSSHKIYAICGILNDPATDPNSQPLYSLDHPNTGVTLSRVSHLSTLASQLDSLNLSVSVCKNGGTWFRNCPQEPWIAINPTNPQNMICGMIQDRLTWDEALGVAIYFTFDGGVTWKESNLTNTKTQNPTIPGLLNDFQCDADPNIQFDQNGTAYMLSIPFSASATSGYPSTYFPEALVLRQSFDGGQTWTKPTYIVQDGGSNFLDRQTIWPDTRKDSQGNPKNNNVYALWTDDLGIVGSNPLQCQLKFARSRDGGNTWDLFDFDNPYKIIDHVDQDESNPNNLNNVFFLWGGELTVIDNGTDDGVLVVTICNEQLFQGPNFSLNIPSQFLMYTSTNGGTNWSTRTIVRDFNEFKQAYSLTPDCMNIANFQNGIDVAYNPANQNIYAVTIDTKFAVCPAGVPSGGAGSSLMKGTVNSAGVLWDKTTLRPISQCGLTNGKQLYQPSWPSIAVTESGDVGILYGDFRDPDNQKANGMSTPTDWWLAVWSADLSTFKGEIRLTPNSFDTALASIRPEATYGVSDAFMLGDYVKLRAIKENGKEEFVAVFVVTNPAPGVTPADRTKIAAKRGAKLNIDQTRRQDVIFARIDYQKALQSWHGLQDCKPAGSTPSCDCFSE